MTEDEKERKGRKGVPLIEDRDAVLSEQLTVKMSKRDRRGLRWLIEQDVEAFRRVTGRPGTAQTEAALMRDLLTRELAARGYVDAAEAAPTAAHVEAAPAAVAPEPLAPALPPPSPAPTARAAAAASAVEEAPAKPSKATGASVRKLLEECVEKGLQMSEAATRSGIDRSKLSHFKNRNAERGELKPDRLAALDAALRRWLEEQGGAR